MADLIETPGVVGIIAPTNIMAMSPDEASKGHDTVTMVFDLPVKLTLQTNKIVFYPKGVHEVPRELADHWYLKAHGVQIYNRPISAGAAKLQAAPAAGAPPAPTGLEALSVEELRVMAKGYGLALHPATGAAKIIAKINEAKAGMSEDPGTDPAAAADPGAQS